MQIGSNDQENAHLSPEMIEAGARVIEEWSLIEDPHALAERVYSAMAQAGQLLALASPGLPSGSATVDQH